MRSPELAALLAVAEIGLGSFLHAFHVPLTGQFLSLNQCFFLSRFTLQSRERLLALKISQLVALLKSLSPAGKRLTPMLAISMQGLLFSLPVLVLGPNILGVSLGALLMGTWAFLQPILLAYLFLGESMQNSFVFFLELAERWLGDIQALWIILTLAVGLKAFFSIAVVWLAWKLPEARVQWYTSRLAETGKRVLAQPKRDRTIWSAYFFHPVVWISFLLTLVFLFIHGQQWTAYVYLFARVAIVGIILGIFLEHSRFAQKIPLFIQAQLALRRLLSEAPEPISPSKEQNEG